MEDVFEILVVFAIFIIGAVSKSNKKKKKAADKPKSKPKTKPVLQAAMAQTAPMQPAQPVVMPLEALAASADHRQNLENAIAAFSDLLDADEEQNPKPSGSKVREKTSIEAEAAMKERSEIIKTRVLESLSGESPIDEHGCIGGSMPDHSAEGESLKEHAVHERERRQRLAAETALRAEGLRKPSATDLRKAVIMSEILDKPVSLRRRSI